jgi:acyl-CoA oxidase
MSAIIAASQQRHRGDDVNRLLLPRCLQFVDAIGHRMAWEAAITQGLPEPLIRLYEISAVGTDLAWYVEKRLFSRDDFFRQEDEALSTVYSHLQEYLDAMDIAPYAVAAITSDSSWKKFSDSLKVYEGNADYAPFSETIARARL